MPMLSVSVVAKFKPVTIILYVQKANSPNLILAKLSRYTVSMLHMLLKMSFIAYAQVRCHAVCCTTSIAPIVFSKENSCSI